MFTQLQRQLETSKPPLSVFVSRDLPQECLDKFASEAYDEVSKLLNINLGDKITTHGAMSQAGRNTQQHFHFDKALLMEVVRELQAARPEGQLTSDEVLKAWQQDDRLPEPVRQALLRGREAASYAEPSRVVTKLEQICAQLAEQGSAIEATRRIVERFTQEQIQTGAPGPVKAEPMEENTATVVVDEDAMDHVSTSQPSE